MAAYSGACTSEQNELFSCRASASSTTTATSISSGVAPLPVGSLTLSSRRKAMSCESVFAILASFLCVVLFTAKSAAGVLPSQLLPEGACVSAWPSLSSAVRRRVRIGPRKAGLKIKQLIARQVDPRGTASSHGSRLTDPSKALRSLTGHRRSLDFLPVAAWLEAETIDDGWMESVVCLVRSVWSAWVYDDL